MSQIIDLTQVKKNKLKKKKEKVLLTLEARPMPEYLDHHMEIECLYASILNMVSENMNEHLKDLSFIKWMTLDTDIVSFHRFMESYVECKEAMNDMKTGEGARSSINDNAGDDADAEPVFKYAFRYIGEDVEGHKLMAFDFYEKHSDEVERSLLVARHLEEQEEVQLYSWADSQWMTINPDEVSSHPQVFFSREEEREMFMAYMAAFPDMEEETYGEFYNQLQLMILLKRMLADESRFVVINEKHAKDPQDKNVHVALSCYNRSVYGMAITMKGEYFEVRRYLNADALNHKGYHLQGSLNEVAFRTKDMEKVRNYASIYWDHALTCQDAFLLPISATALVALSDLEDTSASYMEWLDLKGNLTEKIMKSVTKTEEKVKRLVNPNWKASKEGEKN